MFVLYFFFFFFNDTATTEIYTLSLHDALPIRTCSFTSSITSAPCMLLLVRSVWAFASAWRRPVKLETKSVGLLARTSDWFAIACTVASVFLTRCASSSGQNALHFLGPLAVGDVAADLRCADHLSRSVAQRRHCQRYVNAAAIPRDAHGLVMIDVFAALQPREDLPLLAMQFGQNDPQDRLADHLARLVPEDARRA